LWQASIGREETSQESAAFGPDFGVKGLQVLHELLAATASVGFLANLSNTLTEFTMRDVLAAAATS
jgi:hypothetical protein